MIAFIAAARYLERIAERVFEARMQQVAIRIYVRSQRRLSGKL
jgi:hypothetical protein